MTSTRTKSSRVGIDELRESLCPNEANLEQAYASLKGGTGKVPNHTGQGCLNGPGDCGGGGRPEY